MRKTTAFLIPVVSALSLALASCSRPEEPLQPSFAETTCILTLTRVSATPLPVAANSRANSASWFIKNTGTGSVTLTGQRLSSIPKPPVTAIRLVSWTTFPTVLAPGEQIDADLSFDVGASGSGGILGLTITSNCTSDKATPTYSVTISTPPPPGGRPYGPISGSHWTSDSTLAPNMGPFTLSAQGVDAGNGTTTGIVRRMSAAKGFGKKLMLVMTGGDHSNYMTDFDGAGPGLAGFDRRKWTQRQQSFNTSAIKTAVATRISDGTVVGADVMDEPYADGGPSATGNTWGPSGTMVKNGTSPYDTYRVTVAAPGAAASATSIPITSLYKALPNGTRLTFLPGLNKTAVLTSAAAQGATSLTVSPLPTALSANNAAHSNSIDNMVAEVKNIFSSTLPVGVTHQHELFWPHVAYAVTDFIIDQYSVIRGDVTTYKNDGVAMATAHGHKIAFSINVINGGARVTNCAPGTTPPNCNMTPTEVRTFASVLGPAGAGLFMWRYDAAMFGNENYRSAFQDVAVNQAALSPTTWRR